MNTSHRRKPGARRAEIDWNDLPPMQSVGSISDFTTDDSSETKYPSAVLWIPDPEQRHGWREFCVYPSPPKQERKPLGWR